jgi:hypothetical protein
VRITIVCDDNVVLIDGRVIIIDCSSIAATIHAVQWYDTYGEIEYKELERGPDSISDLSQFQSLIDAWTAAAYVIDNPPALSLDEVKDFKTSKIREEASETIFGSYVSSALGTPHTYPNNQVTQMNLSGSVIASLLPNLPDGWTTPFWCADSLNVWNFAPHTASQIQQVGIDCKAFVIANQIKIMTLLAQIADCTTVEEVISVVWQ